MPAFYLPMYGINNWCSIRAAAVEELEEQEASTKTKIDQNMSHYRML